MKSSKFTLITLAALGVQAAEWTDLTGKCWVGGAAPANLVATAATKASLDLCKAECTVTSCRYVQWNSDSSLCYTSTETGTVVGETDTNTTCAQRNDYWAAEDNGKCIKDADDADPTFTTGSNAATMALCMAQCTAPAAASCTAVQWDDSGNEACKLTTEAALLKGDNAAANQKCRRKEKCVTDTLTLASADRLDYLSFLGAERTIVSSATVASMFTNTGTTCPTITYSMVTSAKAALPGGGIDEKLFEISGGNLNIKSAGYYGGTRGAYIKAVAAAWGGTGTFKEVRVEENMLPEFVDIAISGTGKCWMTAANAAPTDATGQGTKASLDVCKTTCTTVTGCTAVEFDTNTKVCTTIKDTLAMQAEPAESKVCSVLNKCAAKTITLGSTDALSYSGWTGLVRTIEGAIVTSLYANSDATNCPVELSIVDSNYKAYLETAKVWSINSADDKLNALTTNFGAGPLNSWLKINTGFDYPLYKAVNLVAHTAPEFYTYLDATGADGECAVASTGVALAADETVAANTASLVICKNTCIGIGATCLGVEYDSSSKDCTTTTSALALRSKSKANTVCALRTHSACLSQTLTSTGTVDFYVRRTEVGTYKSTTTIDAMFTNSDSTNCRIISKELLQVGGSALSSAEQAIFTMTSDGYIEIKSETYAGGAQSAKVSVKTPFGTAVTKQINLIENAATPVVVMGDGVCQTVSASATPSGAVTEATQANEAACQALCAGKGDLCWGLEWDTSASTCITYTEKVPLKRVATTNKRCGIRNPCVKSTLTEVAAGALDFTVPADKTTGLVTATTLAAMFTNSDETMCPSKITLVDSADAAFVADDVNDKIFKIDAGAGADDGKMTMTNLAAFMGVADLSIKIKATTDYGTIIYKVVNLKYTSPTEKATYKVHAASTCDMKPLYQSTISNGGLQLTLEACQAACFLESTCTAAQWDSTTTFCLLLTETGEMDADATATDQKCAMKGTAAVTGSCKLKSIAVTATTLGAQNTIQQCQDQCTLDATCTAVTYDTANKACSKITAKNKLVAKAGAAESTVSCAVKEFVTATGTCTVAANLKVAGTAETALVPTSVDKAACLGLCQAEAASACTTIYSYNPLSKMCLVGVASQTTRTTKDLTAQTTEELCIAACQADAECLAAEYTPASDACTGITGPGAITARYTEDALTTCSYKARTAEDMKEIKDVPLRVEADKLIASNHVAAVKLAKEQKEAKEKAAKEAQEEADAADLKMMNFMVAYTANIGHLQNSLMVLNPKWKYFQALGCLDKIAQPDATDSYETTTKALNGVVTKFAKCIKDQGPQPGKANEYCIPSDEAFTCANFHCCGTAHAKDEKDETKVNSCQPKGTTQYTSVGAMDYKKVAVIEMWPYKCISDYASQLKVIAMSAVAFTYWLI